MLETIPDKTVQASIDVGKYVDWLKKAFRDSKEILEDYLDNWDMSLSSPYAYKRNFSPGFVPALNLTSKNVREFIPLEVETIAAETAGKISTDELTLVLNEKTPPLTTYTFIDFAGKTLNEFIQNVNNLVSTSAKQGKLFPYVKIGDAYLPLEEHLMRYPVKELKAWKDSKVALVYIVEKKEEKEHSPPAKTKTSVRSSPSKPAQVSQAERQKYLEEAERIKATLATLQQRYELVRARAMIEGAPELQEEANKLEKQINQLKQELTKIQATLTELWVQNNQQSTRYFSACL
jgi:hypothetical protein